MVEPTSKKDLFLDRIFTRQYYEAYDITTKFVLQHTIAILQKLKVESILSSYASTEQIIAKVNLIDKSRLPLEWMFRSLSEAGYLESKAIDGVEHYKICKTFPVPNHEEIAQEMIRVLWPSRDLISAACGDYLHFLTGEKTGIEILFKGDRLKLWLDYFGNEHYLYSVFNTLGAYGVSKWWNSEQGVILEVGGGTGAAALSLLNSLRDIGLSGKIREYIFSDLSLILLRLGKQVLLEESSDNLSITEKRLDFNKSLVDQGIEHGSVNVVYGVNALHVANDLLFSLREIHQALAVGGMVVISEFARPSATATLHPEVIFNLLDDFRCVKTEPDMRPAHGFLTPKHWQVLLQKAGFKNIEMMVNNDSGAPHHRQILAVVIKGQKM